MARQATAHHATYTGTPIHAPEILQNDTRLAVFKPGRRLFDRSGGMVLLDRLPPGSTEHRMPLSTLRGLTLILLVLKPVYML